MLVDHDTLVTIFLVMGSTWFAIDIVWNITHWVD